MNIERMLRLVAGTFIILSLILYHFHSVNWLWFTLFIGANLLQSGFTNWCLMMNILKLFGFKSCDTQIKVDLPKVNKR